MRERRNGEFVWGNKREGGCEWKSKSGEERVKAMVIGLGQLRLGLGGRGLQVTGSCAGGRWEGNQSLVCYFQGKKRNGRETGSREDWRTGGRLEEEEGGD